MSIVIGLDDRNESLRAGGYGRAGRCLATASQSYDTRFSGDARVVQDPEDWRTALAVAVREAVARAGGAPDAIRVLAVDTTCCSVVALYPALKPFWPAA